MNCRFASLRSMVRRLFGIDGFQRYGEKINSGANLDA
jgi:hypothetical protein